MLSVQVELLPPTPRWFDLAWVLQALVCPAAEAWVLSDLRRHQILTELEPNSKCSLIYNAL